MADGGKKTYSCRNLETLDSDELYQLIDDIPSDNESETGDVSDNEVENEFLLAHNIEELEELFDMMSLPIEIKENTIENCDDDDFDSEDDVFLSVILQRELAKTTTWTKSAENCIENMKTFMENFGPSIEANEETPTNVFLAVFPEDLIELLVFQTNLYALQKYGKASCFVHTNKTEMKKFLAINMLMGIKKMPSFRDYWSSNLAIRDQYISQVISRDRFIWLLGHLHLNDNAITPTRNSPNYDKLYKLRPVIDKLSETFGNTYKPSQNQAIDESMIKFKGRSSLKQYMPQKPIKRGYKVWVRADASGFACQFQIYTGKVGDSTEKDLGARVVIDLTRPLVGKGHHVYFDNYFNSVALQKKLQKDLIYRVSQVRVPIRRF